MSSTFFCSFSPKEKGHNIVISLVSYSHSVHGEELKVGITLNIDKHAIILQCF